MLNWKKIELQCISEVQKENIIVIDACKRNNASKM